MIPLCSWLFLIIDGNLSSKRITDCSHTPGQGRLLAAPLTLTVNRPFVLFRLPMKNWAPLTDRVGGKGTSAILKHEWTVLAL